MLWFFVDTLLVQRKINRVQLDAGLDDGNQRRVGHFFRTQGTKGIDRTDQRLDFDSAFPGEAAEGGKMKMPVLPTLDQTVPREIIECLFKPAPVPASPATLFHLEYAKTGLKKFYDFVSRNSASSASRCDEHPDNQCTGISVKEAGNHIFRCRRNIMLPILMFLMRTCRNQVGRAALRITEPPRTADQVLVFSDAVWRRPWMFEAEFRETK